MDRYDCVRVITEDIVKNKLPIRKEESHKGDYGRLLCVCGSKSMPGAANLCIGSALRCGVGLVRAAIPDSIYHSVSSRNLECTYCLCEGTSDGFISENSIQIILDEAKKCSAVAVGSGMGWNNDTKNIVYGLIKNSEIPMVIDADGINVISENIDILKEAKGKIILTPHLKEAERLLGVPCDVIAENKAYYAQKLADEYGVVAVVKGHNTIVADNAEKAFLNRTGNSGMAKGGSGDVLTGMVGAFLAQGLSPTDAALCSVYIHGRSGDICKEKYTEVSMLPSDLIDEIGNVLLKMKYGVNL